MTPNPKLVAYLHARYATEIADGWEIVARGQRICMARRRSIGWETKEIDLPPHLRPVADVENWHREHQAGRPIGLPLFAEREDPTAQGCLL